MRYLLGLEDLSDLSDLSKTQKLSKIKSKFAKSSSSRAGIPIVRFLVTNSVIKEQKSVLEMAIRTS